MSNETEQKKITETLSRRVKAAYPILDKNDPHYMLSVLAADYALYIAALTTDEIDFFKDGIAAEFDYFEFDRDGVVQELSEFFGGVENEESLMAFRDVLDKVFPDGNETTENSYSTDEELHFSFEDEIAFMKKPPQE